MDITKHEWQFFSKNRVSVDCNKDIEIDTEGMDCIEIGKDDV